MCFIREVGGVQKGGQIWERRKKEVRGREGENWVGRSERNDRVKKGERVKVLDRREGELEDYD